MSFLNPDRLLPLLRAQKPAHDPSFIARYVGGVGHEDRRPDEQTRLKFLGLKVPQIDQAVARIKREGLGARQLLQWADRATYHEELSVWLYLLDELDRREPVPVPALARFVPLVDNWAVSDQLSSVMARAFERDRKTALPYFKRWNESLNPWARRQSLVGLYYYASQRKKYPPRALVESLVRARLGDPHFYVQKGVGWTLREHYNVLPKAQEAFVRKNLREISSTAWFATSEKYPNSLKRELTGLRARARKASGRLKAGYGSTG